MDAGAISTLLNPYREQLKNNCFDPGKINRLFEREPIFKRIVRMIFGFNAANYHTEGFLKSNLRKIFHCEEPRAVALTRLFIECFDDLEQKPVGFDKEAKNNFEFTVWMETAEKVSALVQDSKCSKLRELGSRLHAKQIGMRYRIEKINGGEDKEDEIHLATYNELIKSATDWNLAQFNAVKIYLSDKAKAKIAEVCRYRLFAAFLIQNKFLREEFFKWIIRDKNDVASFVEFSGTMDWMGSVVTKRFAGYSEVRKIDNFKVLGLPFEGKYHCVLDRKKVITFKHNYQLSIAQIVKLIQDKRYREGNINFYATKNQVCGFVNWHNQQLGSYNPAIDDYERIDVTKPGWEKKVFLAVEYSEKTFRRRFHKEANLKDNSGYGIAFASRTSPTLDILGTHGWYGYAFKTEYNTFTILHTGQFGDFPNGLIETLLFIGNTTPGVMEIHDENNTYLMRHITPHVTRLQNGASEMALERIKKKIIKARDGNLVFQIGGKGCAGYAAKSYSKDRINSHTLPSDLNLYGCHITDSRPKNFLLNGMRKIVALVPSFLQPYVFKLVMLPFFPYRSCTTTDGKRYSLSKMRIWNDLHMFHPGLLAKQQEEQMRKYAKNEITWENAHYLNHWDEDLLKVGKFNGFLQKIYDEEMKTAR